MRRHYPLSLQGVEDAALLPWSDGVPGTGEMGSYPGQKLVTDTEAEVLAAQDAAGLPRTGTDLAQLAQAISRGLYLGGFNGSANALSAALPNSVVFPAILRGMRFTGSTSIANTGGVTINLTGFLQAPGPLPLLRRDGQPLQAGDLPVGDFFFVFDGSAYRTIVPTISEINSTTNSQTINYLLTQGARARLKTQYAIDNIYVDASAIDNYQTYNPNYTDLGSFTVPAGYVCINLDATFFIAGNTTPTIGVYLAIFANANDGNGWFLVESNRADKPPALTVTLSRPGLMNLDPTKSYSFSARVAKDASGGVPTLVSGNLLGLAFKF